MSDLIKIREVAARYNLSARTLRYYEDMGLIASSRSQDYAYRLYDQAAITRLEQILILRKLNVSIKDIQRVFDVPGSGAVLKALGRKVDDIDNEIALLHELKDIILQFIRLIKEADFASDSDVKLLYEKAHDIESQLVNVDYDGNASNVNRLLDVAGKLEKNPDVVRKLPHFYNIFNVINAAGAYELYYRAFGVEKVSEVYPGGVAHIGIQANNIFVLLIQVEEPVHGQGCAVQMANADDLRKAFTELAQDGQGELHEDWEWTPLAALVTDRHSVNWMLCL